MLPDVYAVFFAGDAAPRQTEELRKQSQGQTPLLLSEIGCFHKKDLSSEPRTRSYRVSRKENNRPPDSIYKKGEDAWLSVEGLDGSYPVSIDSEGMWDYKEHQWKYQVRQTDGKLYENGKLVGENDLNRTQR